MLNCLSPDHQWRLHSDPERVLIQPIEIRVFQLKVKIVHQTCKNQPDLRVRQTKKYASR